MAENAKYYQCVAKIRKESKVWLRCDRRDDDDVAKGCGSEHGRGTRMWSQGTKRYVVLKMEKVKA